jgi:phosphoserine phosphatase
MREGKVRRLLTWCTEQSLNWEQLETWGYSDSINDLPLLEAVTHATVTQGDPKLRAEAFKRDWPQTDWF